MRAEVDTNTENRIASTSFHCVNCGKIWGEGIDIGSSGFCQQCFIEWGKSKKDCFASVSIDTCDCRLIEYCERYYGIK